MEQQKKPALYDPSFEHDACGIGAVVNIKGIKTHKTVEDALTIVETLEHRAGKDAEPASACLSLLPFSFSLSAFPCMIL